ncbi:MAG: glycosyltransferase, partial [Chitinophagia bacterium]
MILSIIIPVYNESRTIIQLLDRVKQVELIQKVQKQFVIVNDSSTDNTEELIQKFKIDNSHIKI